METSDDGRHASGQQAALPELAQTMIEAVARFMRADHGSCTLEFRLRDGRLERWFRHEGPAAAAQLNQFAES